MSGSPIIQDGRLVGAVTHVFIEDTAKGYGIFADEMYSKTSEFAESTIEKRRLATFADRCRFMKRFCIEKISSVVEQCLIL